MRFNVIEALNSVTMVFPLLAWWKHRKTMRFNLLHKIMRFHVPFSTLFHLVSAFHARPSKLKDIMYHIDISLIHFSSFASSLKAIQRLFKRRNRTINTAIVATCMMHGHVVISNIQVDRPIYRFSTLLISGIPVCCIIYKQNNVSMIRRLLGYGALAFGLYLNNKKVMIGHPIFHVVLYKIYDNYFTVARMIDEEAKMSTLNISSLCKTV